MSPTSVKHCCARTISVRPVCSATRKGNSIATQLSLSDNVDPAIRAKESTATCDVMIPSRADRRPFRLYTVAETSNPIRASGGVKIVPHYTLGTAPTPRVIVIPAHSGGRQAMLEWLRKSTRSTDITMSVCLGATLLASTGLLSGKAATTHHAGYREFAR